MRAVVTCLVATGIMPKAPTVAPDSKLEGLSCATVDIHNAGGTTDKSNLVPTIALVVLGKENRGCFTILQHPKSRDNLHLRCHQERCHLQHLWHHPHGLERRNKRTRVHRNLCSPLKRPPRWQRQLLVRARTKVRTQLRYNGSQTCSANHRNS